MLLAPMPPRSSLALPGSAPARGSVPVLAIALAALALAGLPPGAAAPAAAQADAMADVRIRPELVAGRVHVLFGRGGNVGLVAAPEGSFLVDDQFAPLSAKIQAAVEALGGGPVRFVVNTHWHGDHTGGNEAFGDAGSVIVAHENVRRRLSTEQVQEIFGRTVPASPEAALPVITFGDGVTFHWGGETIEVVHVPHAHTDGDAVLRFVESDVIHAGDIVFNGTYPFVDVDSGGSIDGMIAGVNRILALAGPETRIIPGHGPLASPEDLRRYRRMLETVRERVAVHVAAGRSADETVAAKPTAELDEAWGGGFMSAERFVRLVHASLSRD